MELYLSYDFFWFFTNFFIDGSIRRPDENVGRLFDKAFALREVFRHTPGRAPIEEWLSFLGEAGSKGVHMYRYEGWLRLQKELPSLSLPALWNLYAVLCELEKREEISFPAQEILRDLYPDIVLQIVAEGAVSPVFACTDDVERFAQAVCAALSDYVLAYCAPDDFSIWGENLEDPAAPPPPMKDSELGEEYEQIGCYVIITDIETVERMKRASEVAWYYSDDVDGGTSLICNLFTFTTGLHSDAVTLQITGRARFNTYEEMFDRLGVEAFGYRGKNPAECARETKWRLAETPPEAPMALHVKKLPQSLLTTADLTALKAKLL